MLQLDLHPRRDKKREGVQLVNSESGPNKGPTVRHGNRSIPTPFDCALTYIAVYIYTCVMCMWMSGGDLYSIYIYGMLYIYMYLCSVSVFNRINLAAGV